MNQVLIVDDDAPVRAALALFLKASGFATQGYPSGDALLEARDWKDADCMILDIRMPGLSGMDVLAHPKVSESGIPVIIMTGHGDVPLAVQAMKLGAFDFVEKPFAETALADRVRTAIARGKSASGGLTPEQAERRIARLTPREHEVFLLVAAGKLNKMIAGDLNLSSRTVEIHRARDGKNPGAFAVRVGADRAGLGKCGACSYSCVGGAGFLTISPARFPERRFHSQITYPESP